MGVIRQGILGGFSGKVGGVVGSSWKGIAVMKAKPLSVANPRTAGQVAQRSKMSNVTAFATLILATVIKPLWDRFQTGKSGYNAFVSRNIALFASEFASPAANLVISEGKMASTAISAVDAPLSDTDVTIDWLDDSGEGFKLATDECYIVIVNETQGVLEAVSNIVSRDDLSATVTMPAALVSGDVIRAYLAFRRTDGTIVSNTAYSTVTVA